MARQPTFYVSHGGGPAFWIDYPPPIGPGGFDRLKAFFEGFPSLLPEPPRAYLVASAHWEESVVTVSDAEAPGMLYDYYGFPEIAYTLQHPAPGAPEIARQVHDLLKGADIKSAYDSDRGFDHGVFVPMKIIDPEAKTPTVMMSLRKGLDPAFHLDVGKALAPLRDEGVIIIGSGSSFHDLRTYFDGQAGKAKAFDDWLVETALEPKTRDARLVDWTRAPAARDAHPREEHLLPLMVAAGAAEGEPALQVYKDVVANKPFSGFQFG